MIAPRVGEADISIAFGTERMRRAGLRITQPRLAVLRALIRVGHPVSVGATFKSLPTGSADRVTVFRILEAFESIGIVRLLFSNDRRGALYAYEGDGPACYAISRRDGSVTKIDIPRGMEITSALATVESKLRRSGYSEVSHVVQFYVD